MSRSQLIAIYIFVVTITACSATTSPGGAVSAAACTSSDQCGNSQVCVGFGAAAACVTRCSVSSNECGATATCGPVGALSVNVCEPKPAANEAPKPADAARIPCTSDAQCATLQTGAICAQNSDGARDCTIPCTARASCNPSDFGAGVTTNFMDCAVDESNKARKACLPDPTCFSNISSCYSIKEPSVTGGI